MSTADPPSSPDVTRLLSQLRHDQPEVLNQLMPLVYEELRDMASKKLRFERRDHTLNTTALVHEAYMRLARQREVEWQSRAHFFAIAAQAMRRILMNYAAKRNTSKRGGDAVKLSLDAVPHLAEALEAGNAQRFLALDEALRRLELVNERSARVVEFRFFGGLTYDEIGEVLGVSGVTARRSWMFGKTWLRRELAG